MIRFSSMTMITFAITAMLLLPSAVLGQCTICADGTQSFNSDKLVPALNATCLELEFFVSFAGSEDLCAIARQHAAWCECPGAEPTCTFCPIGSEPVNPDLVIPESEGATCRDFNYFITIAPSGTPCDSWSAFIAFCGGCGDLAPTASPVDDPNECSTLCPDGTNAPNPDAIIYEGDGEVTTCGQLEAYLTIFNPFDSCLFVWYLGVSKCGCNDTLPLVPEDAFCTLCEDGSAPPNLSFEIIPDYTCRGLGYLLSEEGEATECAAVQATAGVYCGCDNPIASQNACRICGDRLLPDTSRIADPASQTFCVELEIEASFGEITCTEVQDTWASTCCSVDRGSPPPTAPVAPTAAPSETTSPTMAVAPTAAPSKTAPSKTTSPTMAVAPTAAPSKTRIEDPTSDAKHISINLACIFLAGVAMLLII